MNGEKIKKCKGIKMENDTALMLMGWDRTLMMCFNFQRIK